MEQKNKQEELVLSWKWYIKTFSIIVAVILFLLYGVYSPVMNYYSKKHIKIGDKLRERLSSMKKNTEFFETEARHWFAYSEVVDSAAPKFSSMVSRYTARRRVDIDVAKTLAGYLNAIINATDEVVHQVNSDSYIPIVKAELDYIRKLNNAIKEKRDVLVKIIGETKGSVVKFNKVYSLLISTVFMVREMNEKVQRFASFWDYDRCIDVIIDEYNMALAYNRRNVEAHYKLGQLYIAIEQYEEGYKEYSYVVKFKPRSQLAKKVISYLEGVVKEQPKNLEALYYLGMMKLYTKQKDEAISLFNKIKSIDAKSYMAFEAQMRLVELFPKQDFDNDGMSNGKELKLFTEPLNPDTDGDGVYDGMDKDPLDPEVR